MTFGPADRPGAAAGPALHVLVVDDEPPALEELAYLLRGDARIGRVSTAGSGADALRTLQAEHVDGLFLDIKMPGLDGLEVARVLAQFATPPPVVFVTAYDEHAVAAFEVEAVDYLLKPVREERLGQAVRRVVEAASPPAADPATASPPTASPNQPSPTATSPTATSPTATSPTATSPIATSPAGGSTAAEPQAETIAVELAGVTRFVPRSEVRFVEAHGDYARLHVASGSHLVRMPLAVLEERWAAVGFVRIHRRYLVALHHIDEVHIAQGRWTVRLGDRTLQVSRRHTRELRDLLLARAGQGNSA